MLVDIKVDKYLQLQPLTHLAQRFLRSEAQLLPRLVRGGEAGGHVARPPGGHPGAEAAARHGLHGGNDLAHGVAATSAEVIHPHPAPGTRVQDLNFVFPYWYLIFYLSMLANQFFLQHLLMDGGNTD